jgi:hypothetical protein
LPDHVFDSGNPILSRQKHDLANSPKRNIWITIEDKGYVVLVQQYNADSGSFRYITAFKKDKLTAVDQAARYYNRYGDRPNTDKFRGPSKEEQADQNESEPATHEATFCFNSYDYTPFLA